MTTLTAREQEIAEMVAKGLPAKRIAAKLGVSRHTVNAHIRQAAMKLGGDAPARAQLTVWFYSLKPRAD